MIENYYMDGMRYDDWIDDSRPLSPHWAGVSRPTEQAAFRNIIQAKYQSVLNTENDSLDFDLADWRLYLMTQHLKRTRKRAQAHELALILGENHFVIEWLLDCLESKIQRRLRSNMTAIPDVPKEELIRHRDFVKKRRTK